MASFSQSRLSGDVFMQLNNYSNSLVRNIISRKYVFRWKLGKGSQMNQIISQWRQQVTTRHQLREKKAHKRGVPNLPKRKALKFSLMLLQQDSMRWKCFGAVFFSYTQLFRVLARQDSFSLCRVQLVHVWYLLTLLLWFLIVASILNAKKVELISSSIPLTSNKFLSVTS